MRRNFESWVCDSCIFLLPMKTGCLLLNDYDRRPNLSHHLTVRLGKRKASRDMLAEKFDTSILIFASVVLCCVIMVFWDLLYIAKLMMMMVNISLMGVYRKYMIRLTHLLTQIRK